MLPLKVTQTTPIAIGLTEVKAFGPLARGGILHLISDRTFHLAQDGDASTDCFRVVSDHEVLINIDPGKGLSVTLGTGETAGTIWVSEVKILGV